MERRLVPRSLPVDLGLVAGVAALVLLIAFGSAHLRPYDAPTLDPSPWLLPIYLLRSLSRMAVAYLIAVLLALGAGHMAARYRLARRLILPTLDVLQSVPILGFFPAAVAVFIGLFGGSALGVEAAAVFLIFTSMFWNMAFGVYESLITVPEELQLAAAQFGLRGPLRWSRLVLPAVVPGLVYNSMLSWANGWYFLIATEIIAVGPARYTLPGLGSYLGEAISAGRDDQMLRGLVALLFITVGMHLLIWSPLATWAERFHLEEMGEHPRTPRIGRLLRRSHIVRWLNRYIMIPAGQQVLAAAGKVMDVAGRVGPAGAVLFALLLIALGAGVVWKGYVLALSKPVPAEAFEIPVALGLSFLRVAAGVLLAVLLALPLAYLTFRRAPLRSTVLSLLEILGSIPATAFFPLIAAVLLRVGLGMNVGSIVLVLTGTFFYVCFNVLSGAAAIPKDLNEAAASLGLTGLSYVRHVFVPAIVPRLVTGCITAWGGGWNAIVLAEYVVASGRVYAVKGIGATLDRATYVSGDLQVVALSLASMVALVVLGNRLFWQPFYQHVAARYKMEA